MRKAIVLITPVLLVCGISCSDRYDSDRPAPETNTERNERDRDGASLTPMDQGTSETDITITQTVRQAIVEDDSLSTTTHNIKVITVDGVVTLRGPVPTEDERTSVYAKAQRVAGVKRVVDELEVITQ